MSITIKKIILLTGDVLILYTALYLSLSARYLTVPLGEIWIEYFRHFTVIFISWILIFYIANLYDLHTAVNNSKYLKQASKALIFSALAALLYFYISPDTRITPKTTLFIFLAVSSALFFSWRQLFNHFLKKYLPRQAVAIIGLNDKAAELVQELKAKPQLGFNPAFIVDEAGGARPEGIKDMDIIPSTAAIKDRIADRKISIIILTSDLHYSPELRSALFDCLPLKISITSLPTFYERITGRIPLEVINQTWFLENLSEGDKAFFDILKRLYDTALAFAILLITAIFWPLIGFLIKLESDGPVFFKQKRLGENGRIFTILKFRTMRSVNNDQAPTAKNDSRITGLGAFMRRMRIDELPQLLNVLSGDMSFVGPRPERPELAADLEKQIPFYRERLLVKPGLTGWDQVSGEYHSPSQQDTEKKLQYDLYYIKNRSIYLDLSIILKTVRIVLSRAGV